jgi:hypothetical protein
MTMDYWVTVNIKVAVCDTPFEPDAEAVIVTELVPRGVTGKGGGELPHPTADRLAPRRATATNMVHSLARRSSFNSDRASFPLSTTHSECQAPHPRDQRSGVKYSFRSGVAIVTRHQRRV